MKKTHQTDDSQPTHSLNSTLIFRSKCNGGVT